eukprot:GEMP01014459.1.p1 GENE.GEMP01014459.1~~GEMP01014459.1.p1  ORF type:complete len:580 (+),score=136.70 GEMP01014459.1:600-2339(+)
MQKQKETVGSEEKRVISAKFADRIAPFSLVFPSVDVGADLICPNFTLKAPKKDLFKDTTLKITQKRRYGLLGPNGEGKSTLLMHIAANAFPMPSWDVMLVEQEADSSDLPVVEDVLVADKERTALLERELQLEKLLETECTEEHVTQYQELLEQLSTKSDAEADVRRILAGLGFSDEGMDSPTSRFSGGWRMRISLAKALFLKPKLLLLDEPTNHLDLEATLWLDEYLNNYPHALMVVSHDADFLDSICTDIISVENQALNYYKGGYSEFKDMHDQQRRQQLKQYEKSKKQQQTGKQDKSKDKAAEIEITKPKDYVVKFSFEKLEDDASMKGISVHDVSFGYTHQLFTMLNFRLDCKSRMAFVGPNGCGKTTLLRLLTGKLAPDEGDVEPHRQLRLGEYSQHFEEFLPLEKNWTAVDFLMNTFNIKEQEARKRLGMFGLPSQAHLLQLASLSGGQKARVCFASICLKKPHLLILDEPTNHLDIESVEALILALEHFEGGLVVVTHDARLIKAIDSDVFLVGEQKLTRCTFESYRRQVLREIDERAALATAKAKRAAEEKEKQRAKRMAQASAKAAKRTA